MNLLKSVACVALSFVLVLSMLFVLVPFVPLQVEAAEQDTPVWDTDGDGVLELLAFGNSFSNDALEYFWDIARDLGIKNIYIGNLYKSGCSVETHADYAKNDTAGYEYRYTNEYGTWRTKSDCTSRYAVTERSWDFISFQQASHFSGLEEAYSDDLDYLVDYAKKLATTGENANPNVKYIWHMTWAYQQDSTHSKFVYYDKDQMKMYTSITQLVKNQFAENPVFENFSILVPTGTAVQNTRTSYVGDTLTRDGYHMSYDRGRYVVGLTFVKAVTGLDISNVKFAPEGVDEAFRRVAVESADDALASPYEISYSIYSGSTQVDTYIYDQKVRTVGKAWDATGNLVDNAASIATATYTKEELPVGSVLFLEDLNGWKYQVVGSSVTEEIRNYVKVTETWWGSDTSRSFNVMKKDGGSLSNLSEKEMKEAFRIYIPEAQHTFDSVCDAVCSGCLAERVVPPHVYDDNNDVDCNECGYVRSRVELPSVLTGKNEYKDSLLVFPEGVVTVDGSVTFVDCTIVGATEIVGKRESSITFNNTCFDGYVYATGAGEFVDGTAIVTVQGTSEVSAIASRKDGAEGYTKNVILNVESGKTSVLGAGVAKDHENPAEFHVAVNVEGGDLLAFNPSGIFATEENARYGKVTTITNNVFGGNFYGTFFGSHDGSVSGLVTNNIFGGTFRAGTETTPNPGFSGSGKGEVNEVYNNITGGSFKSHGAATANISGHEGSFYGNYGNVVEKLVTRIYKSEGATLSFGNNFYGTNGNLTCPVEIDISSEYPERNKLSFGRVSFTGGDMEKADGETNTYRGTTGYLDVTVNGAVFGKSLLLMGNFAGDRTVNENGEGNRKGCGVYLDMQNVEFESHFYVDNRVAAADPIPGNCFLSMVNLKKTTTGASPMTFMKSVEGDLTVYVDRLINRKASAIIAFVAADSVIGGEADLTLKNSTITVSVAAGIHMIRGTVGTETNPSVAKVRLENNVFSLTSTSSSLKAVHALRGKVYGNLEVTYSGTNTCEEKGFYGSMGTVTGNFINVFENATFTTVFTSLNGGTVGGDLVNKITGNCTFNEGFYGSTGEYSGTVRNTIEDATITGAFYGTGGTLTGNVYNTITGTCSFSKNFYGSSGTVTGNIENTVSQNAEIVSGTFCGQSGALTGDVRNYVNKGASIRGFNGAYLSSAEALTMTGNVYNTLVDCTTNGTFVGAGNGNSSKKGVIDGFIYNTFNSVTMNAQFRGSRGVTVGTSENHTGIINHFTDTAADAIWASHHKVYGTVETTVHGGSFTNLIAQGTDTCTDGATVYLYDDGKTPLIGGEADGVYSICGYGANAGNSTYHIYGGTYMAPFMWKRESAGFGMEYDKTVLFYLYGDITLANNAAALVDEVKADRVTIKKVGKTVQDQVYAIAKTADAASKITLQGVPCEGGTFRTSTTDGVTTYFGIEGTGSAHVFDHACDVNCNECGQIREVPDHVYDNACDKDCNVCAAEREVSDHVYDNEEDLICNECGFEREFLYTPGDLDGEEGINSADAIYLLYHTLFGEERYPVNQPCDYDKDGAVSSADAIYLLYHTLFGKERYPLQ